ncbi:tyrosine-type recombinase/integrase [Sphingomonas oryzagri]
MAVHRFTDKWLQSPSIIPSDGRAGFVDAVCPGLHLRVTVKGTRTFSVLVRPSGKARRITIGTYPRVTLSEARDTALETLRAADRGVLGTGSRSIVREDLTLRQLVDAYVAKHLKPNARSWKNIQGYFLGSKKRPSRMHHLLSRPISEIEKRQIVDLIDGVMAEGKPQAAVNLLRYIKMLFNWAADRDIVPANPFERIRPPARTQERDRILDDAEIAAVWYGSFQLMEPYGQMYRMFLLTGQRRSEVATMRWNEIDGQTWTIPRAKVKKDRAHAVPLTATALETLASLPRYGADAFVFTTSGGETASSNFAKVKREIDRLSCTSGWTIHDIRRTVRSKFAELRVPREVARKVMNHESDGKIDRIYNRHEYLAEKREALERWETRLLEITSPSP